jgi:hypothetical protein
LRTPITLVGLLPLGLTEVPSKVLLAIIAGDPLTLNASLPLDEEYGTLI